MLNKLVVRTGVLSAGLTLLSSCVPRTAHLVHPGTEGCGQGCDLAAGGWPFIYIVDSFGISAVGSVDLLDATLIGTDQLWWGGLCMTLAFWVAVVAVAKVVAPRCLARKAAAVPDVSPVGVRREFRGLFRHSSPAADRRTAWRVLEAYVLLSPAFASVAFALGLWLFVPGGRLSPDVALGIAMGCYQFGALPSAVAGWVHHVAASAQRSRLTIAAASVAAGTCATFAEMAAWAGGLVELYRMVFVILPAAFGLLAAAIWHLKRGASLRRPSLPPAS